MSTTATTPGADEASTRPPRRRSPGQRWLDAPVRLKLLSVVLLIALVCTPSVAMGLVLDDRLDDAQGAAEATADSAALLDTVQTGLQNALVPIQAYGTAQFTDATPADDYREASAPIPGQVTALLERLPAALDAPGQGLASAVEAMLGDMDRLVDFGAAGTQPADTNPAPDVFEVNPGLVDPLVSTVTTTADAYRAVERLETQLAERLADQRAEAERVQSRLVTVTLISMVGSVVAAAGGTYAVTNGMVRRIERLARNSERFLADEPLEPDPPARDELGRLVATTFEGARLVTHQREAAWAATRAKDDFLARVSHELKTPLTAMIGFAQLLEEDPDLSPERRADATAIVRDGEELHRLIKEMLDVKALEAGKLALAIEPVVVGRAADEALRLIGPTATGRGLATTSDCPADVAVEADRGRLREVLINLLSNAVRRSRRGGTVDVRATRRNGIVRVAVSDAGPAITPDEQRTAFDAVESDPAGRDVSDASDTSHIRLSFTKRLVEVMHGTIGADPSDGEGSTFWFELPAAGTAPAPAAHEAAAGRR